jgi:hypothetical protein
MPPQPVEGVEVFYGSGAAEISFQSPFPTEVECVHCGCDARMAMVVAESGPPKQTEHLCRLYENDMRGEGGFWVHDCCAVAIYFCKKCAEVTALMNQA